MVTQYKQHKQLPSAAKGIRTLGMAFLLWFASFPVPIHAQQTSSSQTQAALNELVGKWEVKFSNGILRIFEIGSDGHVSSVGGEKVVEGDLVPAADGFLDVEFGGTGNLNRIKPVNHTSFHIDHYSPKDRFKSGKGPSLTATGKRIGEPAAQNPATVPPAQTAMIEQKPPQLPAVPSRSTPPITVQTSERELVLSKGWETPMQGGSSTIQDLARLLGGIASPNVNLSGNSNTLLYENVPYLTPFRSALELLKIPNRLNSKVPLASPGLPRNSFFYYSVDGRFEGRFNRMYLVVDGADQVVSVQLVQETPPARRISSPPDLGWHTYNFVNTRTKAMNTLRIDHKVALWAGGKWDDYVRSGNYAPEITKVNQNWTVARIDSLLLQSVSKGGGMEPKEEIRWYVPRPIAELILTCTKSGGR